MSEKNVPMTNLSPVSKITGRFEEFKLQVKNQSKTCKEIKVNDEAKLAVAEKILKETNTLKNNIEKKRKELKKPYMDASKKVDEVAKSLTNDLEESIGIAKKEMLNFQTRLAEEKGKEANEQLEKELTDIDANIATVNKIERIFKNVLARIHGGIYDSPNGEQRTHKGCSSLNDVLELKEWFKAKFPKPEAYKPYDIRIAQMRSDFKNQILVMQGFFKNKPNMSPEQLSEAKNAHNDMINISKKEQSEFYDGKMKVLNKSLSSSKKEAEAVVKSVSKGIVTRTVFEVTDFSLIPDAYKIVDEVAINKFINENKEAIEAGTKGIPGVAFRKEQSKRTKA